MKKTVTTVREFNEDGKIVKETITETTEGNVFITSPKWPYVADEPYRPNWWDYKTISCQGTGGI